MKASLARYAYLIVFLLAAGYALATLRGPKGVHALLEKKAQIKAMEKRNAELDWEIERKREHIKRLGNNAADQELEVRDRLKLIRKNEKVFITGPPEKTQPTNPHD